MSPPEITEVHQAEYHRNGVSGMPFYAVVFDSVDEDGVTRRMLGIQFTDDLDPDSIHLVDGLVNPHTAILDIGLLAEAGVTFGVNSWRGDRYTGPLVAAIRETRDVEAANPDAAPPCESFTVALRPTSDPDTVAWR